MDSSIRQYRIGDATVFRIVETVLDTLSPARVYPCWDAAALDAHASVLRPQRGLDATREHLLLNVNTWVIRFNGKTLLVDTGIGNGKDRPFSPLFHRLDNPYLAKLAAAGIEPQAVDYVLITHLHVDHVGWNTVWNGERWVPTFPNARYVFPAAERAFYETPAANDRRMVFDDSVAPVIAAGLADEIPATATAFLDGIVFHPTPGHSPGHMSIALSSRGEEALFSGDIAHHAIQAYRPDWNSVFCNDAAAARASRRWAFDYAAERDAAVFTAHFPESSAGRISRRGDGYAWEYV